VWCGAAQCSVMRCGTVHGSAVWCSAVQCSAMWCGVVLVHGRKQRTEKLTLTIISGKDRVEPTRLSLARKV